MDTKTKGVSNIDLVIGITIIVFLVGVVFIHTSRQLSSPLGQLENFRSSEETDSFFSSIIENRGSPNNWEDLNKTDVDRPGIAGTLYKTRVLVVSTSNQTQNVNVTAFIEPNENGVNTSFVVYEASSILNTETSNITDANSNGKPETLDITFQVSLEPLERKIVYVYYSDDSVSYSQSSLTQDAVDVEVDVLSTETHRSLSQSKITALDQFTEDEIRSLFGVNNYRIEIGSFVHGSTDSGNQEVFLSRGNVLYQNSTGHVESTEVRLFVW